jgi:hypothetical protein
VFSHGPNSLDSWINFAQLHVVHLWAPQLGHRVAQRMKYNLRFPLCPVRESFYTSDRPLVTSFGGLCWVKHLTFCSQTQRLSSPDIDLVKEAVCWRGKTWVMLATGVKKVRRTSRVLHHWVYRAGTQNAQEISWQCGCIEHLRKVKLSGLISFFPLVGNAPSYLNAGMSPQNASLDIPPHLSCSTENCMVAVVELFQVATISSVNFSLWGLPCKYQR